MLFHIHKEENSKNSSEIEGIINFCKACPKGDEDNLNSCYCLKHGYSKSKFRNLHKIVFVFFQRTAQTEWSSRLEQCRMVPNSTAMTVAVILKSQLLKMAAAGEIQIFL